MMSQLVPPRALPEGARGSFPIGARATLAQLEGDPHGLLRDLRESEPVSWLPALGGWLVTPRTLALGVMRDADTFTVEDPRFSTGRVVGQSMLTRDGEEHARHRAPFAPPFRRAAVQERFAGLIAREAELLIEGLAGGQRADLRRGYAGPLAAIVVSHALGLQGTEASAVLGWYDAIVGAVNLLTAGGTLTATGREAMAQLRAAVAPVLEREPSSSLLASAGRHAVGLSREQVTANAAVLLFGGIETTEGMIANALWYLLTHPAERSAVDREPALLSNAIEESLRMEPAAALVDRYATREVSLGGAMIRAGDLVSVSVSAANRDPASFVDPDRFAVDRPNARQHLAFAHGAHVCIGMHLARLEAHTAVGCVLSRLPRARLLSPLESAPRGLIFRKPPALWVSLS